MARRTPGGGQEDSRRRPAELQEEAGRTAGGGQQNSRNRTQLQRTALLPGISWTTGFSTELYYSGAERLM